MKSSRQFVPLFSFFTLVFALAGADALAAGVDMNDPRRAARREDDVRIDAQLLQDTIGSGTTLSVKYQIENLTDAPIAVAEKIAHVSYDPETLTITFSIGAEIPNGETLPRLAIIAPGEKKTLSVGASLRVNVPSRGPFTAAPRYVQITVSVLRDIAPFQNAIHRQSRSENIPISDDLFDKWLDANDTISLNSIPVRWRGGDDPGAMGADVAGSAARRGMW